MVESVKAASDVFAPVAGEVVEANGDLAGQPALVNEDAEGKAWFFKIKIANPAELDALMDRAAYEAFVEGKLLMRYLPLTDADRRAMLAKIGVADIDALFADVPDGQAARRASSTCPRPRARWRSSGCSAKLAAQNTPAGSVPFFVGAGAYKHHVPATVDHLIQRSEFLTSYTPYQPEIAQGTLQYLFEFQTQVAMLTGMEVANASMYDGSTAAAEAVLMAHRVTKRHKAVLAGNLHPHYRETIETVARLAEHEVVALPPTPAGKRGPGGGRSIDTVSCVVVQTPDFFGHLHDLTALADKAHADGALLVAVVTEAVVARAGAAAGRHGRRHRRRRGPVDRQRADLRRALRRPVRHARRSTCGRCRAACAARPSTRRAGAASC